MATMDDIARELGISKGTVSKALSGAEDVSEAMRKNVLEKAVELGYSRISRSGAAKRLAIFVEHMDYKRPEDFGWDIVTGFRKMAEPAGFSVEIVPLNQSLQRSTAYDEFMLKHHCEGGFFLGLTLSDPWIRDFETCRTPAVLYDNRISSNPSVTYVAIDNQEGMNLAVAHLKALGHQTIGYLSSSLGSYVYLERYRAFFSALREHGLDDRSILAGASYHISQCLEQHLSRLLRLQCTAIICSHDLLAHHVIDHAKGLGLRVPQDLAVIGFDDIPLSRSTDPPLTTIRQNRTELGKSAYYALTSQLNHIPISSLLLHAELIVRGSTGPR